MPSGATEEMDDLCALPLVRRLAAMLDRDPATFRCGDTLPRGWHVALFTVPTRHSQLRVDGLAGLGVTLPDLGLPRIMAGGKRMQFDGDIRIGDAVRRSSRVASVRPKQGRSGRLAVVGIEHQVFADEGDTPVLTEWQDYIMLGERPAGTVAPADAPAVASGQVQADIRRTTTPDEAMLLRYCAITFNTHRIHYDFPYATTQGGYPALVVNGGIPVVLLLELFRTEAGREPASVTIRNVAPLFCGRPMGLCAIRGEAEWRLWAEDEAGGLAVEMLVR